MKKHPTPNLIKCIENILHVTEHCDHGHLDCVFHVFTVSTSYRHSSHPAQSLWVIFVFSFGCRWSLAWPLCSGFTAVPTPCFGDRSLTIPIRFELELRVFLCWPWSRQGHQHLNCWPWLHVSLQLRNQNSMRKGKLLPREKQ